MLFFRKIILVGLLLLLSTTAEAQKIVININSEPQRCPQKTIRVVNRVKPNYEALDPPQIVHIYTMSNKKNNSGDIVRTSSGDILKGTTIYPGYSFYVNFGDETKNCIFNIKIVTSDERNFLFHDLNVCETKNIYLGGK